MDDEKNLVAYVDSSLKGEEDFHFLRLEFLQRLNIANLQVNLARMKNHIRKGGKASNEDMEELRISLQQYGKCGIKHR